MAMTRIELASELRKLDAKLPGLIDSYPDDASFWDASPARRSSQPSKLVLTTSTG